MRKLSQGPFSLSLPPNEPGLLPPGLMRMGEGMLDAGASVATQRPARDGPLALVTVSDSKGFGGEAQDPAFSKVSRNSFCCVFPRATF